MFEQASKLAEGLAAGMSRRGFLGWAGKGALGLTAAVGGLLGTPLAGYGKKPPPPPPPPTTPHCCVYRCGFRFARVCGAGSCPAPDEGCKLVSDRACDCTPA